MAETALALQPSSVLARVGAPQERQYLIGVLAETLGIPAKDAERPDVIAILGMAVQRTSQYGWLSGLHMHCQKFETSESRNRRKSNPNAQPEYTYTLVDGEKAWKDSGSRWRILYGVNWTYNRKPMTRDELSEHARLMGYTQVLPPLAYGIWSRVIVIGTDDPKDPENPMYSSGVFLGKRKVGNNWYDEDLPTQVTSRDVAIRRADKRAMMQSPLTLIPLDDMTPAARMEKLVDHLRSEGSHPRDENAIITRQPQTLVEDDGDMLWATSTAGERLGLPKEPVIHDDVTEEPMEGAWQELPEPPPAPENADARPHENLAARPGACPECHAPAGKPHATSCSLRQQADARPPENADARPAATSDAVLPPIEDIYGACAMLLHVPNIELPKDISALLITFQLAHQESDKPISESQYNLFRVLIKSIFGGDRDDEHKMLLSALCGVAIDHTNRPGRKVALALDWLKDPNKYTADVDALFAVMSLCRGLRSELES